MDFILRALIVCLFISVLLMCVTGVLYHVSCIVLNILNLFGFLFGVKPEEGKDGQ